MSFSTQVKVIKELGLSEYEAKCYLALFERESLSVIEVIDLIGIPRPNAYQALKKLLDKGLCVSLPGNVKRYAVSNPQALREMAREVVNGSLDVEIEELENKKQKIVDKKMNINDNIEKVVNKLQVVYNKNRSNDSPLDYIEIYKDRLQVLRKFSELIVHAKEELLTIEKPTGNWTPPPQKEYDQWLEESSKTVVKLIERGVKCRGLYELSDESERRKWQLRLMEKFSENGEDFRITRELPMKVTTIDSRIVIFTMEDQLSGKPSYTFQIVYHKGMANIIKLAFETLWAGAEDFNDFIKREN